ncbi:ATP-binding protein [Streptomyces sp. FT05W]|uniref:ATP-binding protein n=1 Tax=Streptomyces glycanivorans TaxID=3033808 RepID=A0ABY9JIX4_9ACTN|nr:MULTISPECIES: ATP-binding protein [Streptomyces]MBL1285633.1 ATP-binding protein [Streptomyces silvae]PWS51051.1 ATP-binding protein [Streptomyces sp. FT05W]WLQ66626.1 ATP-binding protein [Streptomyces sp. Alt3]
MQQSIGSGFAVAFTPDECRVSDMRKITAAYLKLWRVPESTAENVILAVSELVTNGIRHGHGDVGLKAVCADGGLRIEVTDGNPNPAQLAQAEDDDLSGRGLFLVAVLAHNWGVSDDGHTTWCVFRLSSGRN